MPSNAQGTGNAQARHRLPLHNGPRARQFCSSPPSSSGHSTGKAQGPTESHRLSPNNGLPKHPVYLSPLSWSLTRTRKTGSRQDKERPSVWPMSIPLSGTSRKTGWMTSGGPQRPTCQPPVGMQPSIWSTPCFSPDPQQG